MLHRTIVLAALAVAAPALAAAQSSPYAGEQTRTVPSLSADEIKGYLSGEGLGMAKAGELNHYPGPKHVLAMAENLGLSDAQKTSLGRIEAAMTAAAIPLGRGIVDGEAALDAAFAAGTIDSPTLAASTARIAELQGRLRAVHLSAHLATRNLLTVDQIALYDRMRGYGDATPAVHDHR